MSPTNKKLKDLCLLVTCLRLISCISGLPVIIRLLDTPLHEFLPEGDVEEIVNELTAETGITEDDVFSRIKKLSEVNPMVGFGGCRFDSFSRLGSFIIFSRAKIHKSSQISL